MELKIAKKKEISCLCRGSWGQIKFFIENKRRGRILLPGWKNSRSACFLYMGGIGLAPILDISRNHPRQEFAIEGEG